MDDTNLVKEIIVKQPFNIGGKEVYVGVTKVNVYQPRQCNCNVSKPFYLRVLVLSLELILTFIIVGSIWHLIGRLLTG